MRPRQALNPRHQFVNPRIVLHGAGAQRIHAVIDGVVPGGKPREVSDSLHFADLGKSFDFGAHVLGAECFGGIHRGYVQFRKLIRLLAWRTALKQQRFILGKMLANLGDHASTSATSLVVAGSVTWLTASMSPLRDISVAQTSM